MVDNQHDCQAFVGSHVLLRKPARMCAVGRSRCSLAGFLLSEFRQASEPQERAHKSTCSIVTCPEREVAELDFEFPFICGLVTGSLVALALTVILRRLCSSRVEPVTLRVRRVWLNHSEDVRAERSIVAQSRISDLRSGFR